MAFEQQKKDTFFPRLCSSPKLFVSWSRGLETTGTGSLQMKPSGSGDESEVTHKINTYPASRGFSLVFISVVLPFSSRFWLLAFCFGCFCAEEKTSADSRLGFLLSMREMKMRLPWNFCVTCR